MALDGHLNGLTNTVYFRYATKLLLVSNIIRDGSGIFTPLHGRRAVQDAKIESHVRLASSSTLPAMFCLVIP